MQSSSTGRLDFLDNLKVAVTLLVVAHHAGQPYGGSGGFWYFKSQQTTNLGPFFAVNAAFFMSLFFMISAYFLPASFDKKGGELFLKDRLKRIGIPLVGGFLLIMPLLMYAYYINFRGYAYLTFWSYIKRIFFGFGQPIPAHWTGPSWPDVQFGHLWFLEHLLFYAVVYSICRMLFAKRIPSSTTRISPFPSFFKTMLFAAAISLLTFAVRIEYPIDKWVGFLGFIQTEFAHVPQYASFFMVSILAYRKNWINQLPNSIGKTWLAIGLFLAALYYVGSYAHWFAFIKGGGFTFGSFVYSFYDTFLCTGLCIGLVYLFREKMNQSGTFSKTLAANAYAVYIIHYPIVVLLQYALGNLQLFAFAKFMIVSVFGICLSFLFSSAILRKIPLLRSIL